MKRTLILLMFGAALMVRPSAQAPDRWPSFRGPRASGVAEGVGLPVSFNGATGANVAWKTAIPGLGHGSPIVWGDRVFVTTAVSSRGGATFKPGLYGEGTASEDRSPQQWKILALDAATGTILWDRTAYEGVPRDKRHIKNTYASSTPATDGRYVAAFFGSEGLYVYTVDGEPAWKKSFGHLDFGAYDLPEYEWGSATSPIIYEDLVIIQVDLHGPSFVAAYDLATGEERWRSERDELPSWSTPTVYPGTARAEVVTNSPNYIRGLDPATGRELWRLGRSSKITAPTPIFDGDLIVVASGRGPERPINVIKAGATGDITPPGDEMSGGPLVWSKRGRGSYMPTPLIYQGYLYVLANQGIFDCYELRTGREVYRQRIPHTGSGFSASPVAADGRIYLSSEDGDIFVVRAGPDFELLGTNRMGELLMATPAFAGDTLFVRGVTHLFAIRRGR